MMILILERALPFRVVKFKKIHGSTADGQAQAPASTSMYPCEPLLSGSIGDKLGKYSGV
jgi:hypothetical protein